jgi:hypothetical protein
MSAAKIIMELKGELKLITSINPTLAGHVLLDL